MRSFIASDNYSAVEVGHLRRGPRPFNVVTPKMNGDRSQVLREGAPNLTLRAEEFGTLKACINVDHIDQIFGGPPLVDADWYAFCQPIYERFEESEWAELPHHYRKVRKAAGAKIPSVRVRRQGAVGYAGSRRKGVVFLRLSPQKKKFGKETDKTGVVGRTSQRPRRCFGQSFEVRGESVSRLIVGPRPVAGVVFNGLRPRGLRHGPREVEKKPLSKRVWPHLDPWDSVRLRTASTHWNVPGKKGPHSELFFLLIKKEQVVASSEVLPKPFCLCRNAQGVCADWFAPTTKWDQLVASLLIWGDMRRYGYPKSPDWDGNIGHGRKAMALLLLSSANKTWEALL